MDEQMGAPQPVGPEQLIVPPQAESEPIGDFLPHEGEPAPRPVDITDQSSEPHAVAVTAGETAMQALQEGAQEPADTQWDATPAETADTDNIEVAQQIGSNEAPLQFEPDETAQPQSQVETPESSDATSEVAGNDAVTSPDAGALTTESEAAIPTAKADTENHANRLHVETVQESAQNLSPHEELYESNPDAYANMPTHEFMERAKEFVQLDSLIEGFAFAVESFAAEQKKFHEAIDAKQMATPEMLRDFTLSAEQDLGLNEAELDALDKRIAAAGEDDFDKSNLDKMQAYKAIIDEYVETAKTRLVETQQRRNEMLGKTS